MDYTSQRLAFLKSLQSRHRRLPWYQKWWQFAKVSLMQALYITFLLPACALWGTSFGRWVYVKHVRPGWPSEGELAALKLVRTKTSVPVPRVLTSFRWRGRDLIFMTRIRGDTLSKSWFNIIDDESKSLIIDQLATYLDQLRSMKSPFGECICSATGGRFNDVRLDECFPSGPFADEEAMNTAARYGVTLSDCAPDIFHAHSLRHPICFTHGDLAPRNILINGTTITGIIDWESAGWFPSHWEYVKAHFAQSVEAGEWHRWIPRFVPVFNDEYNSDLHIRQGPRLWDPASQIYHAPPHLRDRGAERLVVAPNQQILSRR